MKKLNLSKSKYINMASCIKKKPCIKTVDLLRLGVISILLLFIVVPVITIFCNITSSDFSYVNSDASFGSAIINSLIYSSVGSFLAVLLALISAYFLTKSTIKHKNIWVFALTTPMLIPTLSIGLGIRTLFGTNGLFYLITGINFDGTGFFGLILGSTISAFPVAFLLIYDALRYENQSVYDAALTLGVPNHKAFWSLTIPYLKVPLISAFFAAFAWIFSDYGLPLQVAGKLKTLPVYLYEQVLTQFKYGRGAVIALVLLLPAFLSFLFDLFGKKENSSDALKQIHKPSFSFNLLSIVLLSVLSLFILVPQLSFVILAFVNSFPNDMSFSLSHFSDAFSSNAGLGIWNYLWNSVLMAFLTGVVGSLSAYFAAYFASRTKGVLSKAIHFLSLFSLAVPGLVFGLGYVFLFKNTKGFFYGTLAILVVVNSVHFFATPYLMAKNALSKLSKDYEVVGSTMGINKAKILFHVLVPSTIPTLIEMFAFFFVNAMVTISATAFLCTYVNQPLSILINTYDKQGNYEMQAVVSFIILLTNFVAKGLLNSIVSFINSKIGNQKEKNMKLSKYEFDFLTFLEAKGPNTYTQRELADSLTVSVGLINKMMKTFFEQNIIQLSSDKILSLTDKGIKELEPYRVRKAIVIAAGFGSRMAPVTLDTPKPLVNVNGRSIHANFLLN